MHEAFFNEGKEMMYLVMDYICGYSLYDLLKAKQVEKHFPKTVML